MQTPDQKQFEDLAKILASMCVRATQIEDIHAGKVPVTKTGDYSDVTITDAEGNEIAWSDVSRMDNDEMKAFMKEVVNRLFTFFMSAEKPEFSKQTDYFRQFTKDWDKPEIVENLK